MPSARNLSRLILGLLGTLGLAGLGLRCGPDRPATPAKEGTAVKAVQEVQEIQIEDKGRLEPGQVIEGRLKGGMGHRYQLEMKAGQYIHVVVEQKGVDVAIQLFTPQGEERPVVDSPTGTQGSEAVHLIAEATGIYPLEIVCADGEPGVYEARIEALRAATVTDRKRTAAEQRFLEAEDLRRNESWEKGLEIYREVLAVFQEIGEEGRQADSWFRIGWMHKELSELAGAFEAFEQARALYARLGRQADEAIMLNYLGTLQYERAEFQKSLDTRRQGLEIAQALKDRELEAVVLNNIGKSHVALGEIQKGLEAYRRALSLAEEEGDSSAQWMAQFGIGDILVYQGRLESARDALERALALQEKAGVSRRHHAAVLLRLANIDQREGKLKAARGHLEEALALQTASKDRNGQAATLNSLGTILLLSEAKQVEAATDMFRRSLDICRETENRDGEANALLSLGRAAYEAGRDREAVTSHDQAAEIFHEIGNRAGEVSTLFGSARALRRLRDFAGAHERLNKVSGGVESLRNEPASVSLRTGYFATKQHYYDLHIDVLMSLHQREPGKGWNAKALEIHERRLARGFLELLALAGIRRGAAPELSAREREIQDRINALEIALQQFAPEAQSKAVRARQRDLFLELDQIRTEITAHASASPDPSEPLGFSRIQKEVLDKDSLLLVYSLGPERSFLWRIPPEGPLESYVLSESRSWIEDKARQAHRGLSHRGRMDADRRWLTRLSETLLGPIKSRLGTARLIIVTDGALAVVPFAALPDPRDEGPEARPLIARHEIVHLPSASTIAMIRQKTKDRSLAPRRVAVVADPVFTPDDPRFAGIGRSDRKEDAFSIADLDRAARDVGLDGFDPLPDTEREAEIIRELIQDESLRFEALGFEANRETVLNGELRRYRVLHFATHGLLHPSVPELSGLVLSLYDQKGNPRKDGFLRSYEISALDLPAELVVLSACQTGVGQEIRGEGPVSLTRSFMEAGARRVVSSLWNVSDSGTAELMRRFYRGLVVHGLRPAQALRCSQLSMLDDERLSDPYYWAAFIFQGDWELDPAAPGGGIEARATGGDPPVKSDSSLPPPGLAREARCPKLL